MAKTTRTEKKPIEQYDHKGKERCNNPPVGLVTPETDSGKKTYAYDPHLDPSLQWAGKAEHTSFEVPTVSLHVHERIDPRTIIEAVRKRNGAQKQMSLFEYSGENPPLREAIEFYKHKHNWSNRMIAGDSLLVMNSLLEKEGMSGKVQMIYIDPPYGIRYGSNFQPFVNRRDVKDGKDEDLTQEPEMIKAFRDTWELGIHSYLTYLRDRLLLARELLTESGSVFVQISDENVHLVRNLMDEVFGNQNYVALISFTKTSGQTKSNFVPIGSDYLLFYGKNCSQIKYRQLFTKKILGGEGSKEHRNLELPDGSSRTITSEELQNPTLLPKGSRIYSTGPIVSAGYSPEGSKDIELEWEGKNYTLRCGPSRHWSVGVKGTKRLWEIGRLIRREGLRIFKRYFDDFAYSPIINTWVDTRGETEMNYVVQTSTTVIERCLLMTTDPGDLVLDPTCGSGTTAFVAEHWGRRWITCDTSRVAVALAKQRLMTAAFDYYELAHPDEGVVSGFKYKTVPHITLKSIANNEPPGQETLYDQPLEDNGKARVSGPFTVEAVPAPVVKPLSEIKVEQPGDTSVARFGETLRQSEWRAELLKCGIRGKNGQYIHFSRVEPLAGARWLHADAETMPNTRGADMVKEGAASYAQRAVISFGPEHAPLEQRQVALAIEEAQTLVPKPKIIAFASFQFDPEAAKDIDETNWPGVTLLKVQMNVDLLTDDLKKKRASNESFWLIGQPDVKVEKVKEKDKIKYRVEVLGFDYYNTRTGDIDSGGTEKIAMWMLDTDYDGRSLFPQQVFFPMSGEKDGWSRLAKNLKAEVDEELIEAYRGTVSLPFEAGKNRRIAVKIVDDRGIESLKIVEVK
ncbi:MAG: site-specific DNA-methyltransferase [Euryarchaeota archaeon]|nr:site-specific DNA-methyltransferase [Euryarchaeota archaeon]MBU4340852.1 site-specific DNA-methyltransferase [Euryarchaeota archaeon]MBU4454184.1 site-specific DNA-methyltransferase [Euryarchaeota archaeon]MCG2734982.1 site-specific DNA-methyltransferase [Candidatus Methanoperedenaceae archaeon]